MTYEEEKVLPLAVLGRYAAPGGDLVHGLCLVHHVRHRRVVHLGFTHLCFTLGGALPQFLRIRIKALSLITLEKKYAKISCKTEYKRRTGT
jgi:hypothetical protein